MYFWYVHNNAYMIRREMIEDLMIKNPKSPEQFLFDGSNFRGFLTDLEIIMKGYLNSWASGITSICYATENESHLIDKSHLIKTESYDTNLKLYLEEGLNWIHKKYGFRDRWQMTLQCKGHYDNFFKDYPEYIDYKL